MKTIELSDSEMAVMAELFETCFIEAVQRLAEKNNLKKGDFANHVWPESAPQVARNRWIDMRTRGRSTKKPINCTLADAYRMARVLGLQMPYLTLQAETQAEERLENMKRGGSLRLEAEAPRRKRAARQGNQRD